MKDDPKTKKQLIEELTELRLQNAALKESEGADKYRSLVENIKDVIYELDSQGVILYISPAVRDMLGFDSTEIIGKNLTELAHEDDLSRLEEWFSELRKGREFPSEYRAKDKSGQLRWVQTRVRPIMEDSQFRGARGILIDITEHGKVAEALRKSEEKFRWVLDNMVDVITVMDMNLRFTYVSPSIIRFRGYTAEEAVAQTLEQVMTPESLQISARVFEEEMKLEASGTADPDRVRIVEVEEYRKNGSIVLMENHLSFMRDEAKKAVGIISVSHDITKRKEAEYKIKKQTDAMEAAIDGIAILNKDQEYTYLNHAHARIYGYENAGELIGESWRVLYDADEIKRFDAEIMPEFGQTGYWQGEALGMKKDGSTFPQEISLTALGDGGLICVVRDMTDHKLAEEFIRDSRILLSNALEMAHLGHWEYDVTNDLFTFNDQFYKIFRTTAEQVGGYTMSSTEYANRFVHPDDMYFVSEETRKAIETTDPYFNRQIEHRMLYADGTVGYITVRFFIVKDSHGRTVKTYGVNQDITERKQAEEKLRQTLESLRKAVGTTIQVMVSAVETRDPYTAGHQIRSADLARAIATEMGLPQEKIDGLRVAGSIHDIGKLSIPAEILSKPGKLTENEFALIKEHPQRGYEILKNVESPWPLAEIVCQHHERMDGSGYPGNLKGDEILMEARILAVADVVEAIASHRPYRPSLGIEAALEEIEENKGILYDEDVVDACLRLFREKGFKLERA